MIRQKISIGTRMEQEFQDKHHKKMINRIQKLRVATVSINKDNSVIDDQFNEMVDNLNNRSSLSPNYRKEPFALEEKDIITTATKAHIRSVSQTPGNLPRTELEKIKNRIVISKQRKFDVQQDTIYKQNIKMFKRLIDIEKQSNKRLSSLRQLDSKRKSIVSQSQTRNSTNFVP